MPDAPRNGGLKTSAKVAAGVLFWWLIVVWVAAPESPSRLYRVGVLSTFGAVLLVAAWPRARRAVAARLRTPGRWFGLVTVNALVLVVLAEGACRLLARFVASPLLAWSDADADARIRHNRLAPHSLHNSRPCNSLGFFDEEFERERTPGVGRIVALGDSFAVGIVPYEENFLTILDQDLDRHRATEVLNFGVSAIGPAEYLHLWRTETVLYQPDLVLVCFFIGNDFVVHKRRSPLHRSRLRSYALLDRCWLALTKSPRGEAGGTVFANPEQPTFAAEDFLRIEAERVRICGVPPAADVQRTFDSTFALLDELRTELGERLRVVLIPDEFQIDDALYAAAIAGHDGEFDRERPNRLLAGHFDVHGVRYLDLLGAIRAAARAGRTYKPCDTHWNRLGNAAAASAIADWLRDDVVRLGREK